MPLLGPRRLSQVTLKALCLWYKKPRNLRGFLWVLFSKTVFTSWLAALLKMDRGGVWVEVDGVKLELAV